MLEYSVIPQDGKWVMRESGAVFPCREERTKEKILAFVEIHCRGRNAQVVIYREDGIIEATNTYTLKPWGA